MEKEIRKSMMIRIRVLKTVVKAGIEVPDNRRKAMRHDLWPEFYKAEHVEMRAFDEFDVWDLVPSPAAANVVVCAIVIPSPNLTHCEGCVL